MGEGWEGEGGRGGGVGVGSLSLKPMQFIQLQTLVFLAV